MIGYVVVGIAGLFALALVIAPLRAGARRDLPQRALAIEEAEGKKRAALTAILDLESERDSGKLAGDEFSILKKEYEAEAVAAFRTLDGLGARDISDGSRDEGGTDEDAVEAEVARIRAKLRS